MPLTPDEHDIVNDIDRAVIHDHLGSCLDNDHRPGDHYHERRTAEYNDATGAVHHDDRKYNDDGTRRNDYERADDDIRAAVDNDLAAALDLLKCAGDLLDRRTAEFDQARLNVDSARAAHWYAVRAVEAALHGK